MEQSLTFETFTRGEMDKECIKEKGRPITDEEWDQFLQEEKEDIVEVKKTFTNFALMHVKSSLSHARELAIALGLDPEKADKILTAYTENDIK